MHRPAFRMVRSRQTANIQVGDCVGSRCRSSDCSPGGGQHRLPRLAGTEDGVGDHDQPPGESDENHRGLLPAIPEAVGEVLSSGRTRWAAEKVAKCASPRFVDSDHSSLTRGSRHVAVTPPGSFTVGKDVTTRFRPP
jgi:hypothetical protein